MKKKENNGGNGNNSASEEKTIEVNGTGEMEVMLTAEGEIESLETSNYQTSIVDGKCLVTYDIKVIIDIENTAEVDVKDPVCESVTETV